MTTPLRIAVVTDSTSDISPEQAQRDGITVVPLNIHFGDDVYLDQVDISTDDFMRKMESSQKLPTTSQPSIGAFEHVFTEIGKTADEIIVLVLSAKLSGTFQSATLAAENLPDQKIHVVDTMSASWGLGYPVYRARELAEEGLAGAEIAEILRAETDRYHVVFFVETLEHLRRGGRIGKAAQMVGSLLQLRPLLRVDQGQIVPFERTRTRGKAIQALVNYATEFDRPDAVTVLWATTPDDADKLANTLREHLPNTAVTTSQIGPVIGTHLGPDILGVAVKERISE